MTINNTNAFDVTVPRTPEIVELPPEEVPEQALIIGVRLSSTFSLEDVSASQISQDGGSFSLFVPRLGNVYFEYSDGSGGLIRSEEFPYKQTQQVVFAPRACRNVVVSPESGVTTTFSLVVVVGAAVQTFW